MHLSWSSRWLDQFRIPSAVHKIFPDVLKWMRIRIPIDDVSLYSLKLLLKTFSFLLLNVFYIKYHLINHFLLMLRNFFSLHVHTLPVYKEIWSNFLLTFPNKPPGLLFSTDGCFLFNYFLCWLPGRQELNSRQKCGNKFGVCFSPSLLTWDYFSHEYFYSMILRTAVSESEILVKNAAFS